MRFSTRLDGPCPTTRSEHVRLSLPQAIAVGANEPAAKRLYELMFGAKNSVRSRMPASRPATKRSNTSGCVGEHRRAVVGAERRWMWHELPSRSSYLAMNEIAMPSWAAISFAPFL